MEIEIRSVKSDDEYLELEQLERDIWGMDEVEVIPRDLMRTAQKNGGLVLGAYAETRLVGFVFGFAGLQDDGRIKHCSHMAGVLPGLQDQNIGYRLKLAQRELLMERGIDLITWTYDPLESRNGRFNLHKLGAECNRYVRNAYGAMRDSLNAGLPSDRFEVDWWIGSERVKERIEGLKPMHTVWELQASGGVVIHGADEVTGREAHVLFEIPSDFQKIKAEDSGKALEWRLRSREVFEMAFKLGYSAVDLLVEGGRSFYLMEKL